MVTKFTKKQILNASRLIVNRKSSYTCMALLKSLPNFYEMSTETKENLVQDYLSFLGIEYWGISFGRTDDAQNQLARSLALLLYAEARKDIV